MGGLLDTLALGSRSLNTYRRAIDTTGHNLANVNTPGYTRQRAVIQSVTQASDIGEVGGGADVTQVEQLKNDYFNQQVQVENSVQGSLQTKSDALQDALNALQETIDRNSSSGTSTGGISQGLADFFAGMQSLSNDPSSVPERQVLVQKAQTLATTFNQVDSKLGRISDNLNQAVSSNVTQVNSLAKDIANLNAAIVKEEAGAGGAANDLRDERQTKLEDLSKLVKIDTAEQSNGSLNVILSGVTLVDGVDAPNTLETFDPGSGALQVRQTGQTTALDLTGGSIEGSISTRDTDISAVRSQINDLAKNFISAVNQVHSGGFGLNGTTGANFFDGTGAGDIAVNSALVNDPAALQASSSASDHGNNDVVVALAKLGNTAQAALSSQTFSDRQAQIVAGLGQKVATAQNDLDQQNAVSDFVQNQRDSVSGVSLDEEMSNLINFQKAFEASAKLISMTNELLNTIIQM